MRELRHTSFFSFPLSVEKVMQAFKAVICSLTATND